MAAGFFVGRNLTIQIWFVLPFQPLPYQPGELPDLKSSTRGLHDSGETLMGIITDANEEIRVIPLDRWKSDWEGYATLHAAIRINHPAVMAGTWNVIHVDFCRIVTNWMNDLEMIEDNHATGFPPCWTRWNPRSKVIRRIHRAAGAED